MSKLSRRILIINLSFFGTLVLVRVTGMLALYSVPTPSNVPALKVGSYFLASNIPTPQRGDFVIFDVITPTKTVFVKRLCGLPGDTIEMRQGVFYVNGENFDRDLNLNLQYMVATKDAELYRKHPDIENQGPVNDTMSVVMAASAVFSKLPQFKRITTAAAAKVSFELSPVLGDSCSLDEFGPIIIPQDKIFVMGDSRYNSLDSRFSGFIDEKAIRGVKIW